jgi:peroxiredoxin
MPKVDIETAAPEFDLVDFTGVVFRLVDKRGTTNVLLIFNRGFT